jgi:hypothetical protein
VLRPGPRRSTRLANTCAGTGPSVVPNTCQTCRDGRWQASAGTVRLTVYKTAAQPAELVRDGGRHCISAQAPQRPPERGLARSIDAEPRPPSATSALSTSPSLWVPKTCAAWADACGTPSARSREAVREYEIHHNQHRPHRSPAQRRAAETATRAGRSRSAPRPKTDSCQWADQRLSPGRMTWTRFSARTLEDRPSTQSLQDGSGRSAHYYGSVSVVPGGSGWTADRIGVGDSG